MAIPENIIDQIQQRVDIVEVISKYVPLKKTGRNYKAPCPFHNEKTPSFIVSQDKQIYHCFGCGAGGNVFSFLMKYENVEFPEAVEMLAESAGVAMPRSNPEKQELVSLAAQLYKINDLAAQFFQNCLSANNTAKEYLRSRGIGDEAAGAFRIGCAPDAWENLLSYFKNKGVAPAILEKAGLVIPNDKGGHYDRFRNRIIFPIIDLKSKILGFGARVLDASLPKYINSPETYIYSKGRNLYGLNFSREHIRREGYALIVEGYLDFIIPYQAGVKNLIATLGTALTVDQIKLIKRSANTVIMVYDPDEAGEAASLRNMDLFISEDVNIYIAELPAGYDPDSCIQKLGSEEFLKLIKSAKNLFDYKMEKLSGRFNPKTANGKASIAGEMLPTISRINNAVLKSSLLKKLAEKLSVDEDALKTELKKVKSDYSARQYAAPICENRQSVRSAEKMILALVIDGGALAGKVNDSVSIEEFKDSSIRDVMKAVLDLYALRKEITPARLMNYLNNNESASVLISEAVSSSEMITDKEKALADCIGCLKKDNIRDRMQAIQSAIKSAHDSNDEDKLKGLMVEYDTLIRAGRI